MSREIRSTNNGAKSAGKKRPAPARIVKEVPQELPPETAIVQKVDMPMALRIKLGSLVVHCEELLSPSAHEFDKHAINTLLQDPDVRAFMEETSKMGILPVKR
jgi:hypothetical protein